jgi:hypothetical protein
MRRRMWPYVYVCVSICVPLYVYCLYTCGFFTLGFFSSNKCFLGIRLHKYHIHSMRKMLTKNNKKMLTKKNKKKCNDPVPSTWVVRDFYAILPTAVTSLLFSFLKFTEHLHLARCSHRLQSISKIVSSSPFSVYMSQTGRPKQVVHQKMSPFEYHYTLPINYDCGPFPA